MPTVIVATFPEFSIVTKQKRLGSQRMPQLLFHGPFAAPGQFQFRQLLRLDEKRQPPHPGPALEPASLGLALAHLDDFDAATGQQLDDPPGLAQLALRAVIGGRDVDQFLADKDALAKELEVIVRQRVAALGLEVISVGIRDVILPGDMKDLMNKVTEAKKAAEANLIVRREETAAMRSQANTAKVLEGNPTLMRLRELEVLERVATSGKLNVVLGEKGLAERVVNLL